MTGGAQIIGIKGIKLIIRVAPRNSGKNYWPGGNAACSYPDIASDIEQVATAVRLVTLHAQHFKSGWFCG